MDASSPIFQVSAPPDEDYPRPLFIHPRNRGKIDWRLVTRYAETGSPVETSTTDIFIKTHRQVDAFWISGIQGPAISARLKDLLTSVVPGDVEFLPIKVNGGQHWFLRVLTVLNALDPERSKIRYFSGGEIDAIERPEWSAASIPDPSLFRIPQDRALWATSTVADAYSDTDLYGLHFWARGNSV
jgi:hypothetical protein